AAVALGRFREGSQQRAARDLGLDGFPLSGDGRLEIACMCCRHGYNHPSPAARAGEATRCWQHGPTRSASAMPGVVWTSCRDALMAAARNRGRAGPGSGARPARWSQRRTTQYGALFWPSDDNHRHQNGGFARAYRPADSHGPLTVSPSDTAVDRRVRIDQDGGAVSAVVIDRSRTALTERRPRIVR